MGFLEDERDRRRREEDRAHEKEMQNRKFRHEWKIAIFSALVGAFLSKPMWALIEWIIRITSAGTP